MTVKLWLPAPETVLIITKVQYFYVRYMLSDLLFYHSPTFSLNFKVKGLIKWRTRTDITTDCESPGVFYVFTAFMVVYTLVLWHSCLYFCHYFPIFL